MNEKSSKGALVCEKTHRILLCDAISAFVLATALGLFMFKLLFREK